MVSIHRMRFRMLQTFRSQANKVYRKNIQLIVALVLMNLFHLISILPSKSFVLIKGKILVSFKDTIYFFLLNFQYISYVCNFDFLLVVNMYFRNEFFRMFHFRK